MNAGGRPAAGFTRKRFLQGLAAAGVGGLLNSPLVSGVAAASGPRATGKDLARHVVPFVGTEPQEGTPSVFGGPMAGNTFPGAVVPFGMVQWSPDTAKKQPGGYSYSDTRITGFSLTHLSGVGCDCFGDFPFMPYPGTVTDSPATHPDRYASGFSHQNESASPGRYAVELDSGAAVDLTVTRRSGFGKFRFPDGDTAATLLINVSGSAAGAKDAQVHVEGRTVSGWVKSGKFCGAPNTYQVYFWAEFDRPFLSTGTWDGDTVTPGDGGAQDASGAQCGAFVTFAPGQSRTVQVRVGISFTSIQNAALNLRAENRGDFDQVHSRARDEWNRRLGQISVEGGTFDELANFYTALYHSFLHPNVFSDVNGEYIGTDGKVHRVSRPGHEKYANYSGWDIYRSQIQLLALLAPQETSDMMQSMVLDHQQGGQLPKWALANTETYIMVGDPAAPIFADAYAFGARDFDVRAALDALVAQATERNRIRPGIEDHQRLGYVPADKKYENNGYGAASTSLEYYTADFSIAELARRIGDKATWQTFMKRAQYWETLLNPETRCIQPRNSDGSFVPGFTPADPENFVEGNSAQYTWMVPFNIRGLFDALGGDAAVRDRLDTFFTELNAGLDKPYAWLGNEPTMQVPWLYAYAGAPHCTQEIVRRTLRELWTPTPGGLAGNDDLGTMSAWYVWAALGMFPQVPGRSELVLAAPLFRRARLHSTGGQVIEITAPEAATDAPYVHGLRVDGRTSTKPWLPEAFAQRGGRLAYSLSGKPDVAWGSARADAPPSFRQGEGAKPPGN